MSARLWPTSTCVCFGHFRGERSYADTLTNSTSSSHEDLVVLSMRDAERQRQDVTPDSPGGISFDNYWEVARRWPGRRVLLIRRLLKLQDPGLTALVVLMRLVLLHSLAKATPRAAACLQLPHIPTRYDPADHVPDAFTMAVDASYIIAPSPFGEVDALDTTRASGRAWASLPRLRSHRSSSGRRSTGRGTHRVSMASRRGGTYATYPCRRSTRHASRERTTAGSRGARRETHLGPHGQVGR